MSYALGIDLGTTFSAAAVMRADGVVELVNLGGRSAAMASVIVPRGDGTVLFGDAAETRAMVEPTRVAREFKRRLGDPTPLVLGGTPYSAQTLTTMLVRHIHDLAVHRMGGPPTRVVVTHPASYSEFRRDALETAITEAGIGEHALATEPAAAAAHYASRATIEVGQTIAVYDLGGGTFDVALLRLTASGFELLGTPVGVENLGGSDFDIAVLQHVDDALGGALGRLDTDDEAVLSALASLRRDCRAAKESLSSDHEAVIPVLLPGITSRVTITRPEFEAIVRPRIPETVAALQRAALSANLDLSAIDRILLVGGSSRIPAIRERVRIETARPIADDVDPEYAVALGAARLAGDLTTNHEPQATPALASASTLAWQTEPIPSRGAPVGRRRTYAAIGAVLALAAGGVTIAFIARGDGSDAAATSVAPTSPIVTTPVTTSPVVTSAPADTVVTPTTVPETTTAATVATPTAEHLLVTLPAPEGAMFVAAFSPDGTQVVTGGADGIPRMWNAATGRQLDSLSGFTDPVFAAVFSPDGARVAVGGADGRILIWDANLDDVQELTGHIGAIERLAFSPDGASLASASSDGTAKIWSTASGSERVSVNTGSGVLPGVSWSQDGSRILTAGTDTTARIWDATSGLPLSLLEAPSSLTAASFSPDGTLVAAVGFEGFVGLFDSVTGAEVMPLIGHSDSVSSVSFSPDGSRLVTASSDGTARVWNVSTGETTAVLDRHTSMVVAAEFDSSGSLVVTASDDHTAKVWDATSGALVLDLVGHDDAVQMAHFDGLGSRVVTASLDGTARIWEARQVLA